MNKKKPLINKKIPKEYELWTEQRIENIRRMVSVPVTKADAMRIIARTEGVEVTKEMIRKMKRIQK